MGEGARHELGLVEAYVNHMSGVREVLQSGSNVRVVISPDVSEHGISYPNTPTRMHGYHVYNVLLHISMQSPFSNT